MIQKIEAKVKAASVGSYLGGVAVLAVLTAVQSDDRLVGWLPQWASPFVLPLVPAAVTFVSGWVARHTPRAESLPGVPPVDPGQRPTSA